MCQVHEWLNEVYSKISVCMLNSLQCWVCSWWTPLSHSAQSKWNGRTAYSWMKLNQIVESATAHPRSQKRDKQEQNTQLLIVIAWNVSKFKVGNTQYFSKKKKKHLKTMWKETFCECTAININRFKCLHKLLPIRQIAFKCHALLLRSCHYLHSSKLFPVCYSPWVWL